MPADAGVMGGVHSMTLINATRRQLKTTAQVRSGYVKLPDLTCVVVFSWRQAALNTLG